MPLRRALRMSGIALVAMAMFAASALSGGGRAAAATLAWALLAPAAETRSGSAGLPDTISSRSGSDPASRIAESPLTPWAEEDQESPHSLLPPGSAYQDPAEFRASRPAATWLAVSSWYLSPFQTGPPGA